MLNTNLRYFYPIVLSAFTLTIFSSNATAQSTKSRSGAAITIQQLYDSARADFYRGNHASARVKFSRVLQKVPHHSLSRNYLAQINQIAANKTGNPAMERKFTEVALPHIEFEESTLEEAVEYLTLLTKKTTGGKLVPNIILNNLRDDQKEATFRLNLTNVPLSYALAALGQQAGVQFRYEKYAVVGTPLPRSGEATAAPIKRPARKPFWEKRQKSKNDLFE